MKEKRKPDFIGNWMISDDEEQQKTRELQGGVTREEYIELCNEGVGLFSMFIGSREKTGGLEKISGTIIDDVGEATFTGEIGTYSIKFKKSYIPKLSRSNPGALTPSNEIYYMGSREKEIEEFRGTYIMNMGEKSEWRGIFTMVPMEVMINDILDSVKN